LPANEKLSLDWLTMVLRSAQTLLAEFEKMLANHIADRDRIRTELAATKY
jgi:hypothetical protein